jgi:hypothetical protein
VPVQVTGVPGFDAFRELLYSSQSALQPFVMERVSLSIHA